MNLYPSRWQYGLLLVLLLYLLMLPKVTLAQTGMIKAIRPYQTVRALVVGVSDYAHEDIRDLRFADDDAIAFSHLLTEETAWKVDPENVVLLTNEKATYERFMAELTNIIDKSQAKDRIFLYFAGHGDVEVKSDRKTGFLLFHNATPTTYAIGGTCEVNTLDDALNRLVLEKRAEVILITDACRSGSLAGNLAGGRTGGPAATAAVIQELFRNTIKILSCQPGESSLEDPELGGGRGLFSYYLVHGLQGAADQNQDRYVNLLEIDNYLRSEVYAASGERQIPDANGPMNRQLTKVDRSPKPATVPSSAPAAIAQNEPVTPQDTPLVQKLMAFNEAIARKDLLYPREFNAYRLYRSLGNSVEAEAFKTIMKTTLTAALQEDPQKALNDYVDAPGSELGRRWADATVYARYPEYLETAANILGEESSFYAQVRSRAHYFRGVNLRLAGERTPKQTSKDSLYRAAEVEQERALALVSADKAPHIFNEQGVVKYSMGNTDAAIPLYQKAYELSPRWPIVVNNLAIAYQENQEFDRAEELFLQAIDLNEELSLPYYNLGKLYQDMEDYPRSIANYRLATSKPTPSPDAFYNLGRILAYQDEFIDYPAAASSLDAYLKLEPDDAYSMIILGNVYEELAQLEKADSLYQRANQLLPEDYYVKSAMADLALLRDDFTAAISLYQEALRIKPDRVIASINLAISYLQNQQRTEALSTLEAVFKSGYKDYKSILSKEDFSSLFDDPAFIALLDLFFPDRE